MRNQSGRSSDRQGAQLNQGNPIRHPDSQRLHEILTELGELHDRKQADYGLNRDPFYNLRAAADFGVPPWIGVMIRLQDKVKRVQAYALKGILYNEGVHDSFKDIAVYAILAMILHEEELERAINYAKD